MDENYGILSIKPEFQKTKIGFYNHDGLAFSTNLIVHLPEELSKFELNTDQFAYRGDIILRELNKASIDTSGIQVIMARGGLLKSIPSGIYPVNDAMKKDLRNSPVGKHSVNIGGLTADYLTTKIPGAKAYIADPAVVDELDEIAEK